MPSGTYQRLVDAGRLHVADGVRVPAPADLVKLLRQWAPQFVVCDRFRLSELLDVAGRLLIVPRVTRWSEAVFDIRALRRMATDGPLAVDGESRGLVAASLSVAAAGCICITSGRWLDAPVRIQCGSEGRRAGW